MTREESAQQLSGWLAATHPDLFLALYNVSQFGSVPDSPVMGGIGDFLSTIGSSISGAVGAVGSWIADPKNTQSISNLATQYLSAKAQREVIDAQLSRMQANQSPLAVSYTQSGAPVLPVTAAGTPVILAPNTTVPQIAGYVPATSQVLSRFSGGAGLKLEGYLPWILGLGGAVLLFTLLRR